MGTPDGSAGLVRSLIPARMDRLPWTRFHTRLVMALGTAWILDGLEITLASAVAAVLTQGNTLHLSSGRSARSPPSTCSARSSGPWCSDGCRMRWGGASCSW